MTKFENAHYVIDGPRTVVSAAVSSQVVDVPASPPGSAVQTSDEPEEVLF